MLPIVKNFMQGLAFWRTDWKTEISKILSLGISMGLFVAVSTVFYFINLYPISGVPNARDIVTVEATSEFGDNFLFPLLRMDSSMTVASVVREHNLTEQAGFVGKVMDPKQVLFNSKPLELSHYIAHRSTFDLFGTEVMRGQSVTPENFERGIWVSESLWKELSEQAAELGSVLTVGQQALPILGVVPTVETTLRNSEHTKQLWQFSDISNMTAPSEQANLFIPRHLVETIEPTLLETIFEHIDSGFANFAKNNGKNNVSFNDYRTDLHGSAIAASEAMMVAGGVLLIIGLFNTINLCMTQNIARLPELSIRKLMGASTGRFILERIVESTAMAFCSLVIAIIVYSSYLEFIPSFVMDSRGLSRLTDFYKDSHLLIIAASCLLIALVMVALAVLSVLLVSGKKYREHLAGSGKGTSKSGYLRFTRYLMAVQIMMTTLFIFVGAMVASHTNSIINQSFGHNIEDRYQLKIRFNELVNFDAENETENRTDDNADKNTEKNSEEVQPPSLFETKQYQLLRSYADKIEDLLPGVEVINLDYGLLSTSFGYHAISVQREDGTSYAVSSRTLNVSPNYLSNIEVVFLAGRDFSQEDLIAGENGVIINRNMAVQLFPNQPFDQVIGKPYTEGSKRKVIGIIENPLLSPASPNGHEGTLVASLAADLDDTAGFIIHVQPEFSFTEKQVKQILAGQFSEIEDVELNSLEDIHFVLTAKQQLALWSLNLLILVSVLMAIIGIASLTSVATKQRFFEFGIRMSQGATRANLAWLMTKQSMIMLVAGLSGGVAMSYWGYQFLNTHFVKQLPEFNWFILALLMLCSTLLFIASVTVPTRRLLSGNPMSALRTE